MVGAVKVLIALNWMRMIQEVEEYCSSMHIQGLSSGLSCLERADVSLA